MADRELQTILNSGGINTVFLGGTTSADAVTTKGTQDTTYVPLNGSVAVTKVVHDPQTTAPSYVEGTVYYDDNRKTFVAQGPYNGSPVDLGHTMHTHVINNSGSTITKGSVVKHNGVDGSGNVQIELAIADSFANSEIFGVAQGDILNGAMGAITTYGEIFDLDTSAYTAGVPLYLSDTIPGAITATPPTIISRVGGVTVSNASNGKLFVAIINNTNLPTIYGGLVGQTSPTYALTTTAQDIVNYSSSTEAVVTVNATTGIITQTRAGRYRVNFVTAISFTSLTSTRSVTFEIYDVTNTTILYSYVKNIPRDATQDSLSFSFPVSVTALDQVKMRVKASTSMNITFDSIIFDVESVSII